MRRLLPITTLRFLQQAALQGIQFQAADALQKLADVDAVLFDPAIFQPNVALSEVYTCGNHRQQDVLRYAAALGRYHDAPLDHLWSATSHVPLPLPEPCDSYQEGGSGWIDKHLIQVGNMQTFHNLGIALPDDLHEIFHHCQSAKEPLLLVAAAQRLMGAVTLQPLLDPALPDLLTYLRQQRIASYRLATPESFLPDCYAEQIASVPEDQAVAWLQQQREQGKVVALIAASPSTTALLHAAEFTIAPDAADPRVKAAAHVTLPAGGLAPLVSLLVLAQQHKRAQRRNWGITIGANLLTVAGLFTGVVGLAEAMLINGLVLSRESDPLLRSILHAEIHAAQAHLQRLHRSPSGGGGYGQWMPTAQVLPQ